MHDICPTALAFHSPLLPSASEQTTFFLVLNSNCIKSKQSYLRRGGLPVQLPCLCGVLQALESHTSQENIYGDIAKTMKVAHSWIDSKTEESRLRGFWDICQTSSLLDQDQDRSTVLDMSSHQDSPFLDTVRRWFESRNDWLLVFDGIAFDSDLEIEEFMKYLPNTPDSTGNSIIFTSHDRTLAKRQRLFNPSAVKVHPLSIQDARELLFHSLDKKPRSSLEIEKATELVKQYECLPLAVHAAAHALIAQGRSLERYTPGPSNKKLAEPYLEIIEALRDNGRTEALNLIRLLMFFNHNVPVTLLVMGRKTLLENDIEIRSIDREGSNKKELDNTIATLIRYGLVERTLHKYQLNTSLSPEESFTTLADPTSRLELVKYVDQSDTHANGSVANKTSPDSDNEAADGSNTRPESSLTSSSTRSVSCSIDILRVHTVIQGVLRDELKLNPMTRKDYWWWLSLATKMLCRSYSHAHDRIRTEGLIRDYREYEIQASVLWSHYPRKPTSSTDWLRQSRHDLHNVLRTIRAEVDSQSPSQTSQALPLRVSVSIFERGSSSSSDETDSPNGLTRTDTWSLGTDSDNRHSESPVSTHAELVFETFDSEEDWGDAQESLASSIITTRRSSVSEGTEVQGPTSGRRLSERSPRSSFLLQGIFKARSSTQGSFRDLGELRPLPLSPTLTEVRAQRSRDSSRASSGDDRSARPVSAGSEAEASLAAIRRRSPLSSPQFGYASLSRPTISARNPLQAMPVNIPPKPTSRFPLVTPILPEDYPSRSHSDSTSQILYKISPPDDFEDIKAPSGYTSQPMTRDNSAGSSGSNLAPRDAHAAMSTSMPVRSSSFRSIFQSIPTRLLEFGRFGSSGANNHNNENSGMSPISPTFPNGADSSSGVGGFLGLGIGGGGGV